MDQDKLVKEKALEHARAMGCDCEPDIEFVKDGKVGRLTIAHDETCALMTNEDKE
jgi:hypothetical protein